MRSAGRSSGANSPSKISVLFSRRSTTMATAPYTGMFATTGFMGRTS
ncbi:unnamed protein product [Linum tenue]|uniref:Uncharacterized protein n=1 Tax=Linum tenue TaxID=586396 RepID=A0AAV0KZ45_9ROSI|nr:unnamed protein product [Linum tenue]CAI0542434.1 unnamed protein product [Linum tenue]